MANGTTKNMPEWKKVTISYCHRNWNHQRPVELQFNRKNPYALLTPPDSAKIIVGLNGSGKSTLLKTINHFFSLIGGFKHPTDIQIEDFKTKCIERGVGTFQVEIQFDIHRVEPMGGREQDPYVLKFPDLTNFEHYRQTLEEDSSLEKVNDTLLLGPDDEEWGWFSEYIGTIGPITREHHLEDIVTDEVYMEGVKAILCIWAEEFSIVKCTSKYSFEFLSNKFSSNIEIEWNCGAHHHELDHEDLDINREHIFNWNSEKCALDRVISKRFFWILSMSTKINSIQRWTLFPRQSCLYLCLKRRIYRLRYSRNQFLKRALFRFLIRSNLIRLNSKDILKELQHKPITGINGCRA